MRAASRIFVVLSFTVMTPLAAKHPPHSGWSNHGHHSGQEQAETADADQSQHPAEHSEAQAGKSKTNATKASPPHSATPPPHLPKPKLTRSQRTIVSILSDDARESLIRKIAGLGRPATLDEVKAWTTDALISSAKKKAFKVTPLGKLTINRSVSLGRYGDLDAGEYDLRKIAIGGTGVGTAIYACLKIGQTVQSCVYNALAHAMGPAAAPN